MEKNIYLLIGLGNPGEKYKNNKHNVGFLFLDYLKEKYKFNKFKKRKNYYYSLNEFNNIKTALIKPDTYMNLSGMAVSNALSFFKATIDKILIIYDDIALPFGKIRIRENGSSGGHNGLKNIELELGTKDYKRIRIGIDSPKYTSALRDYVLKDFSDEHMSTLKRNIFAIVEESVKLIIDEKIKEAMNKFNGKTNGTIAKES